MPTTLRTFERFRGDLVSIVSIIGLLTLSESSPWAILVVAFNDDLCGWVGGFLLHANIDRIWSSWQHNHIQLPASQRYPTGTTVPAGHRLTDPLYSALTDHLPSTPVIPKVCEMINTQSLYRYDTMPV